MEIKKVIQNDMYIRDQTGFVSSVLKDPDYRSRITQKTNRALFTIYAPQGIKAQFVRQHLEDIFYYIQHFSPDSEMSLLKVFSEEGI